MISEDVREKCTIALESLRVDLKKILPAIQALEQLLDESGSETAAPSKAEEDPDPDEDDVRTKRYESEKWAARKVESLKAEGIKAVKRFNEGVWEVSWTGGPSA